jgi:hypothetical protein
MKIFIAVLCACMIIAAVTDENISAFMGWIAALAFLINNTSE